MNFLVKMLGASILSLGLINPVFAELQSFKCYEERKDLLDTIPMYTFYLSIHSVIPTKPSKYLN